MPYTIRRIALLRAVKLFDLAVVAFTFVVAFAISSGSFSWPSLAEVLIVRIKIVNILIFAGYLVLCSAIFSATGFYLSHRLRPWRRQLREVFVATTLITGVLLVLPFRMALVTAEFLILFWCFTCVALILARAGEIASLHFARAHGRNLRNLVVVGEGEAATALAERIEMAPTLGYRVVQVINAEET